MGPYILHPVVDKDTVSNLFPDLVGAIRTAGGDPYFLIANSAVPLSKDVEAYLGRDHVIYGGVASGNGFSRIKFILAAIEFMRSHPKAVVTNLVGAISYGFDATLVGRIAGCDSVIRVSGNEIETRRCAGRYRGIKGKMIALVDAIRQKLAFAMATRIIVMSKAEKRRVEKMVPPSKVQVCARGVDLDRFVPREMIRVDGPLRVLFVGRNSPEKGGDIFFEVARLLAEDRRVSFTAVGDFPLNADESVKITGYVDPKEMPAVYRKHDLLLMTSRTEGFPQAMVEAMACGLVPMVPRHLLSDYIIDGENGLLISLNPYEIVDVLISLVGDASQIKRMRVEARNWVEKHFDAEVCRGCYAHAVLSGD